MRSFYNRELAKSQSYQQHGYSGCTKPRDNEGETAMRVLIVNRLLSAVLLTGLVKRV